MGYRGTFGVQFLPHHPVWDRLSAPELLRIAETAAAGDLHCIWFSSRFLARDTLALMAAIAARVPIGLGTMVLTPWAASPLVLASTLGTIAELLPPDRELFFGLGSGISQARWVERPRPIRFLRESFEMCRRLLRGESVPFAEYPLVTDYFHLHPHGHGQLSVQLQRPEAVSFWYSPQGPLGHRLAAEVADGIFMDAGTRLGLKALHDGQLDRTLETIEQHRAEAGITRPLRRLVSFEMSLSRDREAAYQRARMHGLVAAQRHRPPGSPPPTLSDEDLRQTFLVGTPEEVGERLSRYLEDVARLGCEHVSLGVPTGPHPLEAVELAGQVLVPLVRSRQTATA